MTDTVTPEVPVAEKPATTGATALPAPPVSDENVDPRDYLMQAVGVEGTFERMFYVFRQGWVYFLVVNICSFAIFNIMALLFIAFVGIAMNGYNNQDDQLSTFSFASGLFLEIVCMAMVKCITDGANIQAVADIYAGQKPRMDSVKIAFSKAFSLLGSCLLYISLALIPTFSIMFLAVMSGKGEVIMICTALAMICIFFVALLTYLMYPSVMIEHYGPFGALRRSVELTTGKFCYIFSVLLLWGVLKLVINVLISSLLGNQNNAVYANEDGSLKFDFNLGGPGDRVISWIFGILFSIGGSILATIIYFSIRIEKENYTQSELCRELGFVEEIAGGAYASIGADTTTKKTTTNSDYVGVLA